MDLVFHTESTMGSATLFKDENEEFVLYFKRVGFLPGLMVSNEVADIKDALVGKRLMTEGDFDQRFDAETLPVALVGEEEDEYDEYEEDDDLEFEGE